MNTENESPGQTYYSPAMIRAGITAAIIGNFLSPVLMASLAISTPVIGNDLGLEIVNL
ncbi:hypothetical protein [Methanoregula sp.]|uniref:hypothetical protein n=1 Tax=Methanoregula sp. TaxID=2052170 RepID=UPI003561C7E2